MFSYTVTGTHAELEQAIRAVKLPDDTEAPEAVKQYALAHVPRHGAQRFHVVLNVQSIRNRSNSTTAGHLTVVVTAKATA